MIHNNVRSAVQELLTVGGHLENAAKEIASDATRIVHKNVVSQAQNLGIMASGDFVRSITPTAVIPISALAYRSTVESQHEAANVIEEGRNPNRKAPPADRILKWMIIKGLEPSLQGAYMIAKKIARDGIKGKHPFAKGEEQSILPIKVAAEIEISEALSRTRFNITYNEQKDQFRVEIPK